MDVRLFALLRKLAPLQMLWLILLDLCGDLGRLAHAKTSSFSAVAHADALLLEDSIAQRAKAAAIALVMCGESLATEREQVARAVLAPTDESLAPEGQNGEAANGLATDTLRWRNREIALAEVYSLTRSATVAVDELLSVAKSGKQARVASNVSAKLADARFWALEGASRVLQQQVDEAAHIAEALAFGLPHDLEVRNAQLLHQSSAHPLAPTDPDEELPPQTRTSSLAVALFVCATTPLLASTATVAWARWRRVQPITSTFKRPLLLAGN